MSSSHEKALSKLKGKEKKVNNLVKGNEGKEDEKGRKPKKEFGAKNNDSEQD